jgi:hypothetical protein
MNINELIAAIRVWQALHKTYRAAAEESPNVTTQHRRNALEALDVVAQVATGNVHNDHVLAAFVALADECERLQASATAQNKRARALRTTVWESARDAKTASAFLQKKDYERAELILELIRTSNEAALKFDDGIEVTP